MTIDFNAIKETALVNFKGGEKELNAKMYFDGVNRILHGRLVPGASIGLHTHDTSSEIIYILSGEGVIICDGQREEVIAGQCHYCPKGHGHTFINESDKDVTFFAVVPEQ